MADLRERCKQAVLRFSRDHVPADHINARKVVINQLRTIVYRHLYTLSGGSLLAELYDRKLRFEKSAQDFDKCVTCQITQTDNMV